MLRSKSEQNLTESSEEISLSYSAADLLKSPVKPRYADRFVPTRAGKGWHLTYPETPSKKSPRGGSSSGAASNQSSKLEKDNERTPKNGQTVYSCLLKNEILGYEVNSPDVVFSTPKKKTSRRLFHFDSSERPLNNLNTQSPFSPSPMSTSTQEFIRTPVKKRRRLSRYPYKVLDAPELADDYYLNLVDWSAKDVISVGLGSMVYAWSAANASVSRIADLSETNNFPTSVKWNERGNLVAVGTNAGVVKIYDAQEEKVVLESEIHNHTHRVGVLEWDGDVLFSGSRDKTIALTDIRTSPLERRFYRAHGQEVCGLKWSSFNSCLASGGNDNTIYLWSIKAGKPIHVFKDHVAAVKALAWSPHEKHILASGGGSSDRSIKFWNTLTGSCIASINTESQVCNVAWSPFSRELVSSHGYAHNQIGIWRYPNLKSVASLTGHTQRVLYMSMSPDGESVCTGAPDETLRFWKVFERRPNSVRKSPLDLFDGIR